MKELLQRLLDGARRTNGPTRVVIAASALLALGVAGVLGWRSSNPHMVPLYTGLDDERFASVAQALSNAGLRFETSSPPAPYSVFVAQPERYRALNAVHAAGAMADGGRGIRTDAGSSTIWMGQNERDQLTRKRDWEELEKQLEALSFVRAAVVRTSVEARNALTRNAPPTVSVVVTLASGLAPTTEQRATLASIVRGATNAPEENITIADSLGNTLFDGTRDDSLDSVLEFERSFADAQTGRAQTFLDRAFGPGTTVVAVTGDWDHERRETVDETLDPTKLKVLESRSETRTPGDAPVGGPAGTASNIDEANQPAPAPAEPPVAETLDEETRYAYSTKTTHSVVGTPQLRRLSVTLLVDSSLAERMTEIEGLVKDLVGFVEARDQMAASAAPVFGLARDVDGKPVAPAPVAAPEPPSATVQLLLERGVELLAAAVFLFVLLRSLRRGRGERAHPGQDAAGEESHDELDLEVLARRQIERLVSEQPETVGTLLSRWAKPERGKKVGASR